MSHRTQLALVLTAAALSGGCGTVNNVKQPTVAPADKPDTRVCCIYGGVRSDWAAFSEYPWERTTAYVDYVAIPLIVAIDLLFDVAADTITLPYTAVEAGRRTFRRSDASSGYAPVVVTPSTPQATPPASPLPAPTPVPPAKPQAATNTPAPSVTIPQAPALPPVTSPR